MCRKSSVFQMPMGIAFNLTATRILVASWDRGVAKVLVQKDSIFNEAIEKKWLEQWLFFANSTRFFSAMTGADYVVFSDGLFRKDVDHQPDPGPRRDSSDT
jgi:hypothetical protein